MEKVRSREEALLNVKSFACGLIDIERDNGMIDMKGLYEHGDEVSELAYLLQFTNVLAISPTRKKIELKDLTI